MHSSHMGTYLSMLGSYALALDTAIRFGEEVISGRLATALDKPDGLAGIKTLARDGTNLVTLSNLHCPFERFLVLVHVSPLRLNW